MRFDLGRVEMRMMGLGEWKGRGTMFCERMLCFLFLEDEIVMCYDMT